MEEKRASENTLLLERKEKQSGNGSALFMVDWWSTWMRYSFQKQEMTKQRIQLVIQTQYIPSEGFILENYLVTLVS